MKSPVIGVTGTIGTGKTTFAQFLAQGNGRHLDADELAKDLMKPGNPAHDPVVRKFGEEITNSEGEINFRKLGELVFSDRQQLDDLESILHPLVIDFVKNVISKDDDEYYVVEAPLLFEAGMDELCDWVVVVTAPETDVNDRVRERGMELPEIKKRRQRQLSESEKVSRADIVVQNHGSIDELETRADEIKQNIVNSIEDTEEYTYD